MPETCRLLLRILYTINSSGYILARSQVPVPVTLINDDTPEYGSVAFKACLEAICRSSPELMQDRSRDFSVYVLDPLETGAAPAPMDISNSSSGRSTGTGSGSTPEQSRGVAVGMGLMSWALSVEEKDSAIVNGTLGKTGTGQDAIEVIIALRETASMDLNRLPNASRSWHTSHHGDRMQTSSSGKRANETPSSETQAIIASIRDRAKAKNKPKKPPRVSSTPVTESDKLLNADTYIGPVRKKGRPTKVKAEESSTGTPRGQLVPQSASIPSICFGTSTTTTFQSISNVASSSQTSDSAGPSSGGMDLAALAALFSNTQTEAAQNISLLNALSLIDSSGSQSGAQVPINPALVNALQQLIGKFYNDTQQSATLPAMALPPTHSSTQCNPPNDDEVVLLNKENLNPAAFKGCQKDEDGAKFAGDNERPNTLSTRPQVRGLGARSIENSPPKTTPNPASTPVPPPSMRKRTLDDCMEERDNKRNRTHRTKVKEKGRSDKREPSRSLSQHNSENGFKYYPRLAPTTFPRPGPGATSYYRTPIETWTTPPRPSKDDNAKSYTPLSDPLGGTTRNRPIVIPDSPQAPTCSASSPIKPTNERKKPYIVPSWARTETVTQPRLSEEAQKAIDAAAEKKREERRANRRKTNAASQGRFRQRGKLANAENIQIPQSDPCEPSHFYELMRPPPLPVKPNNDLPPIIASSDDSLNLFPPINQRAQSPPCTDKSQLPSPVTPKRPSRFASSTPGNGDLDEDSLFTPLSIARRSAGTCGSPLFSPGVFGSPLARKHPKVISPTAYRTSTRQPGSESSTITVRVNETSDDTLCKSKSPVPDPEDSQDDLDCPPSSLPIASSDDSGNTNAQSSANDQADDGDIYENDVPPRKQHWVGLPPSSPPPPTSPGLMPVDDDGELPIGDVDEDLPVASETDEPEDEPGDDTILTATDSDWASSPAGVDDATITMRLNPSASTISEQEPLDEMAFLEQFTTIGNSDDPGSSQDGQNLSGHDLSSLLSGYGDNIDLHNFLETFQPVTQDGPSLSDLGTSFDFSPFEGFPTGELQLESVDHLKLAADLQAMLSGCVV